MSAVTFASLSTALRYERARDVHVHVHILNLIVMAGGYLIACFVT